MPNLAPKTHVGNVACFSCGKSAKVLINKNGTAYYFCPWVNESTGERCNDQHRWGRDKSQEMQRAYIDAKRTPTNEIEHEEAESDDTELLTSDGAGHPADDTDGHDDDTSGDRGETTNYGWSIAL